MGGKNVLLLPCFFLLGMHWSGPDIWSCSSHSVDVREYIAHTLEVAEKEPRKPRSLMTLLAIKQLPLDFLLSEDTLLFIT